MKQRGDRRRELGVGDFGSTEGGTRLFRAESRPTTRPLGDFPLSLLPTPSSSLHRHCAFTLVELLAVVAIIGILAGLTLAGLGYVQQKGARSRAEAEVAAICTAIDRFHADFGTYPACETSLFEELTGQGELNTNTLYIQPTLESKTAGVFMSPWGEAYKYNRTNTSELRNKGFYDLWIEPPGATNESEWIHN